MRIRILNSVLDLTGTQCRCDHTYSVISFLATLRFNVKFGQYTFMLDDTKEIALFDIMQANEKVNIGIISTY